MEKYMERPRAQIIQEHLKSVSDENERLALALSLFQEIRKASGSVVDKMEDGVTISNMDEIAAAFHNETTKATKKLLDALKDLKISSEEQARIVSAIQQQDRKHFDDEFQTIRIKKPRDKVFVENLDAIVFPQEIKINNLTDLDKYFKELAQRVEKALNIKIEPPRVTVEAPQVNIPETKINMPEIDFGPIKEQLKEIKQSLVKIKNNRVTNPLAVRLSDGEEFIDQLERLVNEQRVAFAGFQDNMRIRNDTGQIINPATNESVSAPTTIGDGSKTVTTAGTRVQLISTATPCRYVIITAKESNTGNIYVGGSTVASTRGRLLVALQSEKIDINDLSKIYIDSSVNGEGVTYAYVV